MKRISTLFILIGLFAAKGNAQISEAIETQASYNNLLANCWTFNNAPFTTSNTIGGSAGSIVTQLGSTSEIITPTLVIPTSLNIAFDYNTIANVNGSKTLKIILEINGVETQLESINLQTGPSGYHTATYTSANTPGNNINGNRKIIFRVNANAAVVFDNITINATYTYVGGCEPAAIPLPIKLLSFGGSIHNNKAQLKWSVDENETGDHFVIEKSVDGKNFSEAGVVFVTAKAGTENYSYNEASEMTSAGYYRLKIVNKDNSVSYSRIIALRAVKANGNSLSIMQNPVRNTLAINYTVSNTGRSEINLYNAAGIKVFTSKQQSQKGINAASFNLESNVTPGTYILEVINGTERNIAKMIKL